MTGDLLRRYEPGECGPDGYPYAWSSPVRAIKDVVRQQAGHRCVRCGHPYRKGDQGNGEWSPCDGRCLHEGPGRVLGRDGRTWYDLVVRAGDVASDGSVVEAQWRILTVHHLTGEKADCRWWSLAALCQRCHLTIQGRVRMEQVYPHEHSAWFKPYAAGYYAAAYLGEELTREETEARLDELLALGLAA